MNISFNPAFHSAVLNTLREGVIHLALPRPEAAGQPDFAKRALGELIGISPDSRLSERFSASLDLLAFAARNLREEERPHALAPLWGLGPWRLDAAFKRGIVHYLEEATKEACQVLGESSFHLSLAIWNEPHEPQSGFLTGIRIDLGYCHDKDRTDIMRFQLIPENRFVRSFTISGFRKMFLDRLLHAWPTLFFQRMTDLRLPRCRPIRRIDADLARTLGAELPKSRIKRLDLTESLFLGDARQILKEAAKRNGIDLVMPA